MAHPYKEHAADKVGKARARAYQSGGKVSEDQRLGRNYGQERRDNYESGVSKLKEGMFGFNVKENSVLDQMRKTSSALRSYDISNAVPRRRED
jgi:hypothetical protein